MTNNFEQGSIFDLFADKNEENNEKVVTFDATRVENNHHENSTQSNDKVVSTLGFEKKFEGDVGDKEAETKKKMEEEKKLSTIENTPSNVKDKNSSKSNPTPPRKKSLGDEFKINIDSIVKYAGQEVPVSRYFTSEQIEKGLSRTIKGEKKFVPIDEKELVKKLNDDFAELMPALTSLVYYSKQNIVIPVLQARAKGAEKESIEDSFSKSTVKRIPFQLIQDFITIARQFSDQHNTEIHADIYYDYDRDSFFMDFPKQLVHKYWVKQKESSIETAEKFIDLRYRKVMEIHSHNTMAAIPSMQDNQSERSPILYAIVGRIDRFFPEIFLRTYNPGTQSHETLELDKFIEYPFRNISSSYNLDGVEVSIND